MSGWNGHAQASDDKTGADVARPQCAPQGSQAELATKSKTRLIASTTACGASSCSQCPAPELCGVPAQVESRASCSCSSRAMGNEVAADSTVKGRSHSFRFSSSWPALSGRCSRESAIARKQRASLQCAAMAGQSSRGILRTSPVSRSVTLAPCPEEAFASSFGMVREPLSRSLSANPTTPHCARAAPRRDRATPRASMRFRGSSGSRHSLRETGSTRTRPATRAGCDCSKTRAINPPNE